MVTIITDHAVKFYLKFLFILLIIFIFLIIPQSAFLGRGIDVNDVITIMFLL